LEFKEKAAKLERVWFKTPNIVVELLLLGFAKPRGSLENVRGKRTSRPTLLCPVETKMMVHSKPSGFQHLLIHQWLQ
jgi:hypothetical protein